MAKYGTIPMASPTSGLPWEWRRNTESRLIAMATISWWCTRLTEPQDASVNPAVDYTTLRRAALLPCSSML
jgi:hypothetical protein